MVEPWGWGSLLVKIAHDLRLLSLKELRTRYGMCRIAMVTGNFGSESHVDPDDYGSEVTLVLDTLKWKELSSAQGSASARAFRFSGITAIIISCGRRSVEMGRSKE